MSYLLLWLEGPLQSWGGDSRFYNRASLPFPTRSGVLGLLCCASGRGGEQRDWLMHMADYGQTVRAYARKNGSSASMPLQLHDLQMVGSGYDTADVWQNMMVPKKIDGKKPVGAGTKMTWRHYIQDMAYACILHLPQEDAEELDRALSAPVWAFSLGRSNCPPTDLVGRGVLETEEAALAEADSIAQKKERSSVLTVRDGAHDDGDEVWTLNDVPTSFGLRKEYRSRQVTLYLPEIPEKEESAETQAAPQT